MRRHREVYDELSKQHARDLARLKKDLGWTDRDANAQFDIAINDRDLGTKRESQLVWSGTDRDASGSRYYGVVRLAA